MSPELIGIIGVGATLLASLLGVASTLGVLLFKYMDKRFDAIDKRLEDHFRHHAPPLAS